MDLDQFNNYKEQLISLTDRLLAVKGLSEYNVVKKQLSLDDGGTETYEVPMQEAIQSVRNDLRSGQFRITLIAGFQSGKSTTFNALTGGQEVSPRGALTATSATVIYGMHTDDPQKVNTVSVTWRTKEELLLLMPMSIFDTLETLDPVRAKKIDGTLRNLPKYYDLDNAADRKILKEAILQQWDATPDRSAFYIPLLILTKYAKSAIAAKRADTNAVYALNDVSGLVRFPEHWESRWTAPDIALKFTDDESLFAFVKRVECYVNSPELKRMGCVVVDCPGLFANAYDSDVALEEISKSDATWFLLGGKQVADSEIRQIREVSKIKPDGMIFSINMNGVQRVNTIENIIPANVARLNSKIKDSRRLTDKDFFTYHARLALTSVQANKITAGTLDAASESAILENARLMIEDTSDVREALTFAAEDDLKSIGLKRAEMRSFDLWTEEGVQLARRESGFDNIVSIIEQRVLESKAKVLLVDKGLSPLKNAVQAITSQLQQELSALTKSYEESKQAFENAQTALSDIRDDARSVILSVNTDGLTDCLREEFQQCVVEQSVEDACEYIRSDISNLAELNAKALSASISELISHTISTNLQAWNMSLSNGECQALNNFFDDISTRLRNITQRMQSSQAKLGDITSLDSMLPSVMLSLEAAEGNEWFGAAIAAGGIAALFPGGIIIAGIGAAIGGLIAWLFGSSKEEKLLEKLTEESCVPQYILDFGEKNGAAICNRLVKSIHTSAVNHVDAAFSTLIADAERTQQKALKTLKAGEKEINQRKDVLQHQLTAVIEPLNHDLNVFETEIKHLL